MSQSGSPKNFIRSQNSKKIDWRGLAIEGAQEDFMLNAETENYKDKVKTSPQKRPIKVPSLKLPKSGAKNQSV